MSATTSRKKSVKSGTDWTFLRSSSDEGIDLSDIPSLTPEFWKHAKLRMPQNKDSVTIRIDHDVLQWLKGFGRGYQTRINTILRSYKEHTTHA